jgi:3-hydroxybutyryl-CoA dehydrogenase
MGKKEKKMEQQADWDGAEVLVVGPGIMGSAIAQAYAQNGLSVGLVGRSEPSLRRSLAMIEHELEDARAKGIFTAPQTHEIKSRILFGLGLDQGCQGKNLQLVIESISEDLGLKKELLRKLDEFCPPGVVLATSTSCLDAEVLALAVRRPERVVWMHFFFPAHKNRVGELAALSRSSEESLAAAARYMEAARKKVISLVSYRKGGAANVIFIGLLLEAARLMEEGFSVAGIEEASRQAFSIPVGFGLMLQAVGPRLAAACLASFADSSQPDHPFHRAYANFFSPPRFMASLGATTSGFTPPAEFEEKSADAMVLAHLKRSLWAVAFMTAAEVVEAGIIRRQDVDTLCQLAFQWPQGPFALMNRIGIAESLRIVTEKMELSHRREINFPVPRLLIEQAQKNEPWPMAEQSPS